MKSGAEWNEWREHVLAELKRLNHNHEKQNEKIEDIQTAIATLKVKAGMWGGSAGLIMLMLEKFAK